MSAPSIVPARTSLLLSTFQFPETSLSLLSREYLHYARGASAGRFAVCSRSTTGHLMLGLHATSKWSQGPFVAANCAALPASLIEAELFGYESGAFTGARKQGAIGLLRRAEGGVLLLDEIGDMPLELQSRLLRVLQDREVVPLGSNRPMPVNFGLICSTHRILRDLVRQGQFRADLYYRIAHHTVTLPPLRQHTELRRVIRELWQELAHQSDACLGDDVLARLDAYDWPGNYRQLAGVLHTLQVIAAQGHGLTANDLPEELLADMEVAAKGMNCDISDSVTLSRVEEEAMRTALADCGGNVSAAARRLGISRSTLYRRKSLGSKDRL
jgi:sigma-54 dependent transcriptional regulator, acetoin dehydrogenase operon transcriptional activator AcoR